MTKELSKVGPLEQSELEEANRIAGWRSERLWDCSTLSSSWVTATSSRRAGDWAARSRSSQCAWPPTRACSSHPATEADRRSPALLPSFGR